MEKALQREVLARLFRLRESVPFVVRHTMRKEAMLFPEAAIGCEVLAKLPSDNLSEFRRFVAALAVDEAPSTAEGFMNRLSLQCSLY